MARDKNSSIDAALEKQADRQEQHRAEHATQSGPRSESSASTIETQTTVSENAPSEGPLNDPQATPKQRPAAPAVVDPFDLSRLRLSQDFASQLGAKKELIAVPVSKRHRQEWFRVHPDPEMRFTTALLEWKEDNQFYVVDPAVTQELPGEVFLAELFVTINRNGDMNLWPVKLPREDGRWHDAHRTAFEAAQLAMTKWVRVVWNKSLGAYDVFTADYPEPDWLSVNLQTLVKIAFKDRLIRSADHPIARNLRGVI